MTATTKISFAQALGEAIRREMHRDPNVVCVAAGSSVRRSPITADLASVFDADRIIELEAHARPVSVAAGMASRGLRVICEARAAQLGPDALAPLSELDPGAAGSIVLRVPDGGPELTEAALSPIETRLLDTPHLKLVSPGTPADAKGMLVGCIRRSGSSCVLESEPLYATVGDVPEGAHLVEPGSAAVERHGPHPKVSVVAYGLGVHLASRALELAGVDAELIDLRTIRPLDREVIAASAARTGKVAVVEPAGSTRVGAEVAAVLLSDAFEYLDGPLERIELPSVVSALDDPRGVAAAESIAERVSGLASY